MDIKISQIDKRTLVEVNEKRLPEIFCGYQVKNSNSSESELWLCIQGAISVSELSAKITE
ncbi:MAG TPA: hypothetical protein DDY31_10875 [Lachnospiraceae bacterium]|nr:hypothetical protein [Lachnospiraceae bacterium]